MKKKGVRRFIPSFNVLAIVANIVLTGTCVYQMHQESKTPQMFTRRWYRLTDTQTSTPKNAMMREFGILYQGSTDEHKQLQLLECLRTIHEKNSSLVKHCDSIALATDQLQEQYFAPRNIAGQCWGKTIVVCDPFISDVAHELAHVQHRSTDSRVMDAQINELFDDSYGKGLCKPDVHSGTLSSAWADGSAGPRNGFVSAYGANTLEEHIATYVEEAFERKFDLCYYGSSESFDDPKYLAMLNILKENEYITPEQFETASSNILIHNAVTVKTHLDDVAKRIHKPLFSEEEERCGLLDRLIYETPEGVVPSASIVFSPPNHLSEPPAEYYSPAHLLFLFPLEENHIIQGYLELDECGKIAPVFDSSTKLPQSLLDALESKGYGELLKTADFYTRHTTTPIR